MEVLILFLGFLIGLAIGLIRNFERPAKLKTMYNINQETGSNSDYIIITVKDFDGNKSQLAATAYDYGKMKSRFNKNTDEPICNEAPSWWNKKKDIAQL
jgi:hypothetical protein